MKKILILFCLFLIQSQLWSQSTNWTVNKNDYEYSMTFIAFLNIDSHDLLSENDQVGAFVNGVCRGECHLRYIESQNAYYAYLKVFSNVVNESFEFKIYDSSSNKIVTVSSNFVFQINKHYGNLFQPYSIAEPSLNNEHKVENFSFSDINILNTKMTESNIVLDVASGLDITKLIPEFVLSKGASLYMNSEKQVSGKNKLDFTDQVTYFIVSEDKSGKQSFTVNINFIEAGENRPVFYKKDAVCFNGGVIKVNYNTNAVKVTLKKDDVEIDSGMIIDNEIIFSDLVPGEYKVVVGETEKLIVIH